jgi:hypothetical protein
MRWISIFKRYATIEEIMETVYQQLVFPPDHLGLDVKLK